MQRFKLRALWYNFFKNRAIPSLFFFYSRLLIQANNIANDWIQTEDLWCRKQPLYQLRHNHCLLCDTF